MLLINLPLFFRIDFLNIFLSDNVISRSILNTALVEVVVPVWGLNLVTLQR